MPRPLFARQILWNKICVQCISLIGSSENFPIREQSSRLGLLFFFRYNFGTFLIVCTKQIEVMKINMELINVLTYISGLCIIFVLCRIFILPLKFVLKLFLNSFVGAILILLINFIGGLFNFHIGLNFFTIIFVSILGIPGAILLTVIKLIIL